MGFQHFGSRLGGALALAAACLSFTAAAPTLSDCHTDDYKFTFSGYSLGLAIEDEKYLKLYKNQLYDDRGNLIFLGTGLLAGQFQVADPKSTIYKSATFEVCSDQLYYVPTTGTDKTPQLLKYCDVAGVTSLYLASHNTWGLSCQTGGVKTVEYTGTATTKQSITLLPFPLVLLADSTTPKTTYNHGWKSKRDSVNGLSLNFEPAAANVAKRSLNQAAPKVTIGTMFRNRRAYLFEWIEFYRLLGVEQFLLYDHESTDAPLEVLQPYIDAGIVEYRSWPPRSTEDVTPAIQSLGDEANKVQDAFLGKALEACWNKEWQTHTQSPCQFAASIDMLRKSSDSADWLGFIDIDEFVYPTAASGIVSLPALFGNVEPFASADYVEITGSNFGTNGFRSAPVAAPQESIPALVTSHYILRRSSHEDGPSPFAAGADAFVKASEVAGSLPQTFALPATFARKAFVRPSKALYGLVHSWVSASSETPIKKVEVSLKYGSLKMNHYAYLSQEDAQVKALENGNPMAGYNAEQDRFYSQEIDTSIQYLIPSLRSQMLDTLKDAHFKSK